MGVAAESRTALSQAAASGLLAAKEALAILGSAEPIAQTTLSVLEQFLLSYTNGVPSGKGVKVDVTLNGLRCYINDWFSIAPQFTPIFQELVEGLSPDTDVRTYNIVSAVFYALESLNRLYFSNPSREHEAQTVDKFTFLAKLLQRYSHVTQAAHAAEAACGFLLDPRAVGYLEPAKVIFECLNVYLSEEDRRIKQTLYAVALAFSHSRERDQLGSVQYPSEKDRDKVRQVPFTVVRPASTTDKARILEALDVVESSIRMVPRLNSRESCLGMLASSMQNDTWLWRLGLYYNLALPKGQVSNLAALGTTVELNGICEITCDLPTTRWRSLLNDLVPEIVQVEDMRTILEPQLSEYSAQTSWISQTFRHSSLARSVPFLDSVLHQTDLHDFILTIYHECVHLYSMQGSIGLAVSAFRSALFQIGIKIDFLGEEGDLRWKSYRAPPSNDVLKLGYAEQGLEISQKAQVLTDLWTPWFEGIAVFAELSDGPTSVGSTCPEAMDVLINLFDIGAFAEGPVSKVEDVFAGDTRTHVQKVYELYIKTVEDLAKYRLRTYLVKERSHYLVPYLCVRSIVSAWRSKLGFSLQGSTASRLLLHLTRFGTSDAIPDLGLPVHEFRVQALENFSRWIKSVMNIPGSDLTTVFTTSPNKDQSEAWVFDNGCLVLKTVTISSAQVAATIYDRFCEASATLTGKNAPPERLVGASSRCKSAAYKTAARLKQGVADRATALRTASILSQTAALLTIGTTECPFWLNGAARRLCCIFRNSEGGGKSHYRGIFVPLTDEELESLRVEIERIRTSRMSLSRIADLSTPAFSFLVDGDESLRDGGQGHGRQYFVFAYGNWLKIWPCGALRDVVEPNFFKQVHSCFSEQFSGLLSADVLRSERRFAERMRALIDGANAWVEDQELIEADPWVARTQHLIDDVLKAQQERKEVTSAHTAMALFVFGDQNDASIVLEHGLEGFIGQDPAELRKFLEWIDASAREPCPNGPPLVAANLSHEGQHGFDFRLPASLKLEDAVNGDS